MEPSKDLRIHTFWGDIALYFKDAGVTVYLSPSMALQLSNELAKVTNCINQDKDYPTTEIKGV